jgi:hypothetical protein
MHPCVRPRVGALHGRAVVAGVTVTIRTLGKSSRNVASCERTMRVRSSRNARNEGSGRCGGVVGRLRIVPNMVLSALAEALIGAGDVVRE